ncbi:MAG: 23S rRNA (guanosine(2251)-2'-O)-methyltransferase RlmB [Actinobacteria bacterium]|nr:23S rRNA (guanosine(2251)-2'-O)-methyltransferase RlmB [Actinomycetota bacterium]
MALVAGKNTVIEALKGGRKVFKIIVEKGNHKDSKIFWILEFAREKKIPVVFVDRQEALKKGIKLKQGVAAEIEDFRYTDYDTLLELAEKQENSLLVILDNIEDPQNFGNIIRTAEFFGVSGIVIRKRRSVQVTPVVERISQGATSKVKISRVPNLASAIDKAKSKGFFVVGLDEDSKIILTPEKLEAKTLLVVGGEDRGISRLVKEKCEVLLRLEGPGSVGSLNAASAFAAACYCYVLREIK